MAIKVALLGAGRIGKVHAKAVSAREGVTLVAVADAFPEAAESLAAEYGASVRQSMRSRHRRMSMGWSSARRPRHTRI